MSSRQNLVKEPVRWGSQQPALDADLGAAFTLVFAVSPGVLRKPAEVQQSVFAGIAMTTMCLSLGSSLLRSHDRDGLFYLIAIALVVLGVIAAGVSGVLRTRSLRQLK